ncbi:Uncharacterised protein [uncultured archaeon]|nr:Uncharacterised protein [uncultured archaeon]
MDKTKKRYAIIATILLAWSFTVATLIQFHVIANTDLTFYLYFPFLISGCMFVAFAIVEKKPQSLKSPK